MEREPEVKFDLPLSAGLLDLPGAGNKLSLFTVFAEIDAKVSDHMNGAAYGFLLKVPLSKNVVSL